MACQDSQDQGWTESQAGEDLWEDTLKLDSLRWFRIRKASTLHGGGRRTARGPVFSVVVEEVDHDELPAADEHDEPPAVHDEPAKA